VSSQKVQGPAYMLGEEQQVLVSLNEAVMLSHVLSFNPLGTGARLAAV
jgi:hypothetical protein